MTNLAARKEKIRLTLTATEKKTRRLQKLEKKIREEEARRKSVESFNHLIELGVLVYEKGEYNA
jgi:hypothetical protein